LASTTDTVDRQSQAFLPDFCAAGTIYVMVLAAELVAIVLTLAAGPPAGNFLIELAECSLYVLWVALLSALLLCRARSWLERLGKTQAFVIAFVLLEILCLLVAEAAWQLTERFASSVVIDDTHDGFLLRNFAISSIVIALAMRYLYVSSEWRRSIVLEAQSRVSALQALIRPHFLFNSLNTIAVRWDVDELPMDARLPSLTIQPLVENAIYHDIELLPDGGEVVVAGRVADGRIAIDISNPLVPDGEPRREGNRMALDNIRQRFELAYGGLGSVFTGREGDRFFVRLEFPREEQSP
jgi:two-component system sensor histidine kinase AlgZ